MAIRTEDFVRIDDLGDRARKLVDDAVAGTDQILTDADGTARAAVVDVHKLEHYRQLDSDVPSPFTLKDLRRGLEDIEAGHTYSLEDHDGFMDEMQESIEQRAEEELKRRNGIR